jgi:hypothetical protein
MRGQVNLPALAVALLVVTTTAGLAFALADDAFASSTRDTDAASATMLSERLVSERSPLTARANVLNRSAVAALDADALTRWFPMSADAAVRIRLDGETVAERGDPTGGTTVERVVLVERRKQVTLEPMLTTNRVTLPRRTPAATLRLDPPNGTTVATVRANDRIVLHDPEGLDGAYGLDLSRYATVTLSFDADGPLREGDATVTYRASETTKAPLEVTVDG